MKRAASPADDDVGCSQPTPKRYVSGLQRRSGPQAGPSSQRHEQGSQLQPSQAPALGSQQGMPMFRVLRSHGLKPCHVPQHAQPQAQQPGRPPPALRPHNASAQAQAETRQAAGHSKAVPPAAYAGLCDGKENQREKLSLQPAPVSGHGATGSWVAGSSASGGAVQASGVHNGIQSIVGTDTGEAAARANSCRGLHAASSQDRQPQQVIVHQSNLQPGVRQQHQEKGVPSRLDTSAMMLDDDAAAPPAQASCSLIAATVVSTVPGSEQRPQTTVSAVHQGAALAAEGRLHQQGPPTQQAANLSGVDWDDFWAEDECRDGGADPLVQQQEQQPAQHACQLAGLQHEQQGQAPCADQLCAPAAAGLDPGAAISHRSRVQQQHSETTQQQPEPGIGPLAASQRPGWPDVSLLKVRAQGRKGMQQHGAPAATSGMVQLTKARLTW